MVSSLPLALPGDGRVVGRRLRPDGGRMRGGSGDVEVMRSEERSCGRAVQDMRGGRERGASTVDSAVPGKIFPRGRGYSHGQR